MGTWIEIQQCHSYGSPRRRRSLQWERGLKLKYEFADAELLGRSLQWERGLKCSPLENILARGLSFPAMGTWIEIPSRSGWYWHSICRSLQWERGLKFTKRIKTHRKKSRSLQWERGLKYDRE